MATKVILLEKIEKLGGMGDIVSVKPGYARNFLLPQQKALRANDANIAYFEKQKSVLEKANNEKKAAAEDHAKSLKGLTISMIRQAGETGQLYGSVTARDIAEEINAQVENKIERRMVDLNQALKEIGLFPVTINLHPEVKVDVTMNIARTDDEAKTQLKTGKAVISDDQAEAEERAAKRAEAEAKAKEELMDEDALEAEKKAQAEAAEKAAEDEAKAQAKAEAKAAKKADAVDTDDADVEASAEGADEVEAPAEEAKDA
jgi:large subunit ribosomal protein L9